MSKVTIQLAQQKKIPKPKITKEGDYYSITNLSFLTEGDWSKGLNRSYMEEDLDNILENFIEKGSPASAAYLTHEGRIERSANTPIMGIVKNIYKKKGEWYGRPQRYLVADIVHIKPRNMKVILEEFPFRSATIEINKRTRKMFFKGLDFISEKQNHNFCEPLDMDTKLELNNLNNPNIDLILRREGIMDETTTGNDQNASASQPPVASAPQNKESDPYKDRFDILLSENVTLKAKMAELEAMVKSLKKAEEEKMVELHSLQMKNKHAKFTEVVSTNPVLKNLAGENKEHAIDLLVVLSDVNLELNSAEGKKTISADETVLELLSLVKATPQMGISATTFFKQSAEVTTGRMAAMTKEMNTRTGGK